MHVLGFLLKKTFESSHSRAVEIHDYDKTLKQFSQLTEEKVGSDVIQDLLKIQGAEQQALRTTERNDRVLWWMKNFQESSLDYRDDVDDLLNVSLNRLELQAGQNTSDELKPQRGRQVALQGEVGQFTNELISTFNAVNDTFGAIAGETERGNTMTVEHMEEMLAEEQAMDAEKEAAIDALATNTSVNKVQADETLRNITGIMDAEMARQEKELHDKRNGVTIDFGRLGYSPGAEDFAAEQGELTALRAEHTALESRHVAVGQQMTALMAKIHGLNVAGYY